MAIVFDGENKYIVVSTDTEISLLDVYSASRAWEDAADTIEYHHVFDVSSELLFFLRYGWKFKPSGYSAGTILKINGKITTTEGDGESKTVPPTTGSPVTWQFDTPATAVIVSVGSAVLPSDITAIADAVWDEALSGHLVSGTTGDALDGAGGASATPPTVEEIRTEIDTNSVKLKKIDNDVLGLY